VNKDDLLKAGQVAELLGVSRQRVNQLVSEGKLIPALSLEGLNLFNKSDVEAFNQLERKIGRPKKEDEDDLTLVEPKKRGRPKKVLNK
jgi:excisionase family DNA binding protein